jgi:prepilin-type N-terminal cleavage/methylation domain-containing protein
MQSVSIRARGFTLIELLVVISIIGLLSSLVMPVIRKSRTEAHKMQCAAKLKGIYTFAILYADRKDRAYPIAPGKAPAAHLSIQTLIDAFPLDFEPELFVCPEGGAVKAEPDSDRRFVLDADTSAYTWVARRMKNTARRKALTSDKYVQDYEDDDGLHSGHDGGMNVATTDGAVSFWAIERLDETTGLPRGLVR